MAILAAFILAAGLCCVWFLDLGVPPWVPILGPRTVAAREEAWRIQGEKDKKRYLDSMYAIDQSTMQQALVAADGDEEKILYLDQIRGRMFSERGRQECQAIVDQIHAKHASDRKEAIQILDRICEGLGVRQKNEVALVFRSELLPHLKRLEEEVGRRQHCRHSTVEFLHAVREKEDCLGLGKSLVGDEALLLTLHRLHDAFLEMERRPVPGQ
ncbi:hypothetical protein KW786_01230 [Candidatus Parcubacteria bacterium]|nr:hypothetical protein [Candidatus Parcubacteria bacterium]